MNNAQKLLKSEDEKTRQALYCELFSEYLNDHSLMMPAERYTLIALLEKLRPECAIEIGTFRGGSLSVLAKYCKKVYTLDIDPVRDQAPSSFHNVEFITGNSKESLPPLLERIQREGTPLGFVLMDGDHSYKGVKHEIESLLAYRPVCPLYILIHDSFSPPCRRAILDASWAANPFVHFVEVDLVVGNLWRVSDEGHSQLWNGFGLAVLKPVERSQGLQVIATGDFLFSKAFPE